MTLSQAKKNELIDRVQGGLAGRAHAFVIGYQGIKVPQVTELREKVRQSGGNYEVVKNTLALRAIDGQALAGLKDHFTGATAVVFTRRRSGRAGQGPDRVRQGRAGHRSSRAASSRASRSLPTRSRTSPSFRAARS